MYSIIREKQEKFKWNRIKRRMHARHDRSILSVSRRNRRVGLIEWPLGRRVFDRRKGCCGNRGGVRHTGNCQSGIQLMAARLSAAAVPHRVAAADAAALHRTGGRWASRKRVNAFRLAARRHRKPSPRFPA